MIPLGRRRRAPGGSVPRLAVKARRHGATACDGPRLFVAAIGDQLGQFAAAWRRSGLQAETKDLQSIQGMARVVARAWTALRRRALGARGSQRATGPGDENPAAAGLSRRGADRNRTGVHGFAGRIRELNLAP
jgi:hypothetical protein